MTIFDSVRMKCRTLLEAVNELFTMGGELEQKVDNQEEELVNMQSVMGDVQAGFSEVRDEMDALTDRVDTVEQTYDPEQLNTIKGDIADIEDDIQLLSAGVNGTQSRMDDVEESNAQAVATVQELSETVSTYDTEIANLKTTDVNTMQQVLQQGVELDKEVVARTDADATLQGNIDTLDAGVVKLTGAQNVAGQKTFTANPSITNTWPVLNLYDTDDERGVSPSEWRRMGGVIIYDKNSTVCGRFDIQYDTNGTMTSTIGPMNTDEEGNPVDGTIRIHARKDGLIYTSAPSPSSTSDNSSKIATTSWVNTASSVVHTTGSETIAGEKNFTSNPSVSRSLPGIRCIDTNIPNGGSPTDKNRYADYSMLDVGENSRGHLRIGAGMSGSGYIQLMSRNVSGQETQVGLTITNEGVTYMTAPATRTTGYGTTDVATAGWVDAKLQALEARITALEGGA